MTHILRSQRVCINDQITPADIVIEHGVIAEVLPYCGASNYNYEVDCSDMGNLLITPGFVDLHSDSIEKEIEPRPGASFPVQNALVELDKKLAMAGITTMFHAIAFNDESLVGQRGTKLATELISTIAEKNENHLSIDNLVHARYEITSFGSTTTLLDLMSSGHVQLLSLMDHSPGQGQFRSLEKWKQYHVPVYELSEQQVREIVDGQLQKKNQCMQYLEKLTTHARARDIQIASHDDDSCKKIDFMAQMGITIAEFPLNLETASHARTKYGIATGMGAPNVVRGKSQSGNISARELLVDGCCDFLCSDYHPTSMLQAVYTIHQHLSMPLAKALSLITSVPAKTAQLEDRGDISEGKLADLLVINDAQIPTVIATLKSGKAVYSGNNCFCISNMEPQNYKEAMA